MAHAQGIMPDLYYIYQLYVLGDRHYKDKFDETHMLLTSSKPPILGSYTNRLLGKRFSRRQENMSLIFLLKLLMCAKVNQAHKEMWPLFAGGMYAWCKPGWVTSDYPRDSIYLFNDAGGDEEPVRVTSFSRLMLASNEGILSTKTLSAKLFYLKVDTEKISSGMKQLLKEWRTWVHEQKFDVPFLQLKPIKDEEEEHASTSHKKRKTKHVLKEALKPVMQELLQSIKGLYDTHEHDSMEEMCGKLDDLTIKYMDLAAMCDFTLPRKPGPQLAKKSVGSGFSENDSYSEDDRDGDGTQDNNAVDTRNLEGRC
jgi:hypothetical protein